MTNLQKSQLDSYMEKRFNYADALLLQISLKMQKGMSFAEMDQWQQAQKDAPFATYDEALDILKMFKFVRTGGNGYTATNLGLEHTLSEGFAGKRKRQEQETERLKQDAELLRSFHKNVGTFNQTQQHYFYLQLAITVLSLAIAFAAVMMNG